MHPPLISQKASRFTESVIRGMTVEARKHGAINLPHKACPISRLLARIKAAACRARSEDDINQYAITWGAKNLREAVAEHAAWHLGLQVDPETEITVTCGCTEAMLVTLLSLINPGDEVILTHSHSTRITGPTVFWLAPRRGSSRSGRRGGGLTRPSWPPLSMIRPRRLFSVTPITQPAPSLPAPTLKKWPLSAASGT